MTEENAAEASQGSPTLNPRSASCIVPAVLAAVLFVIAYIGLQNLVANTGPWAIAAAENALVASGLEEAQRAPFEAEVARLAAALEDGSLDSEGVVNGVAGLLDTPIVPMLVLDDVRSRRLPASMLTDEEKSAADGTLALLLRSADTKVVPYEGMVRVLGGLTAVPDGGGAMELGDEELRALVARATDELEGTRKAQEEAATQARFKLDPKAPKPADLTPTHAVLLARYRAHVDAALAGTPIRIQR